MEAPQAIDTKKEHCGAQSAKGGDFQGYRGQKALRKVPSAQIRRSGMLWRRDNTRGLESTSFERALATS